MDDLRLLEEQEALFSFKRRQLQLDREEFELKKRRANLTNGKGGNGGAFATTTPAAHHNIVDIASDEAQLRIKEQPGIAGDGNTPETNLVAPKAGNINVKASIPEPGPTAQDKGNDKDDDLFPKKDPEYAFMAESPQPPQSATSDEDPLTTRVRHQPSTGAAKGPSSLRARYDTSSDDFDLTNEALDIGCIVVRNANASTKSNVRGSLSKPAQPAPSTTSRMATVRPEARQHSSIDPKTSDRPSSRSFLITDYVQPKPLARKRDPTGLGYKWLLEDLSQGSQLKDR